MSGPTKKPRLQVKANSTRMSASDMEMDEEGSELSSQWNTFVEQNGFDVSIVQKLKKVTSTNRFSEKQEHNSRVNYILGALCLDYPAFTEDHAKEALKILFPELQEAKSNHRGPSIVDGLDTKLVHALDLKAFGERIEDLFLWHTNSAISMKYRAPYFALVQSSGMGKTKLFHEFRDRYNQQEGHHCQTILCLDVNLSPETRQTFFDHQLVQTTDTIVETVFERMDKMIRGLSGKVVLLFDEAQGLMEGVDAEGKGSLVFRAIRWWLRKQRKVPVVAVFAGTTVELSNFFPPDPPRRSVSRSATVTYVNYKAGEGDKKMLYPPFFELNTMSCLRGMEQETLRSTSAVVSTESQFPEAVIYGRPLFAYYYITNTLDPKKLTEFAKRLVLSCANYETDLSACYSVLGARVQMGIVNSFYTLTELVSSGYACLVSFRQQENNASTPVAQVTFMPDPLCATLAMRLMDEAWQDGELQGHGKQFWTLQAEKAFTTKLCLPDNGDAVEIFAALYMLFCGDVLRKETDSGLSIFSVSLDEWFRILKSGGRKPTDSSPEDAEGNAHTEYLAVDSDAAILTTQERTGETSNTISFIQVCRNDFRGNSFCKQTFLSRLYLAGLASYAYKNCKAFDIVASIRVKQVSPVRCTFHPLLVTVKNWANVSKSDVDLWSATMTEFLKGLRKDEAEPTAVCIIILLGCSDPPTISDENLNSMSLKPFPDTDVFRLVCVPEKDDFGVSNAVQNLGHSLEQTEIYSSHAFVACEDSPKNLLRKSSHNQDRVDNLFEALQI